MTHTFIIPHINLSKSDYIPLDIKYMLFLIAMKKGLDFV